MTKTFVIIIFKKHKGTEDIRQDEIKSENEEKKGSGFRAPWQSV